MVRLLPFFLLFLMGATLLIGKPHLPLRLLARVWFSTVPRGSFDPRVPRWVYHYRWVAPGDPVPPEMQVLEDLVRMTGAILLAPVALVLIILVFSL